MAIAASSSNLPLARLSLSNLFALLSAFTLLVTSSRSLLLDARSVLSISFLKDCLLVPLDALEEDFLIAAVFGAAFFFAAGFFTAAFFLAGALPLTLPGTGFFIVFLALGAAAFFFAGNFFFLAVAIYFPFPRYLISR